ncbi:hypothetical protein D3C81_1838470 [compost metagenome]
MCRISIRIGTEVLRLIFQNPPGHFQTRMFFIRYFYIWKSLIILQQHVIARHMLLNQVALQDECFHIACSYDIFEITYLSYKALGFPIVTAPKVRADTVLQHFGFTDIDDGTFFVLH